MIWMARDRSYKTISTDHSASFHPEVLTMAKMMIVRRTLNGDWLVPVHWNVTYLVLHRKRSVGLTKLPTLVSWLAPLNSCGDPWFAQKTTATFWVFDFLSEHHLNQQKYERIQTSPFFCSESNQYHPLYARISKGATQKEKKEQMKPWRSLVAWRWGTVSREGCDWFFENVWRWYFEHIMWLMMIKR